MLSRTERCSSDVSCVTMPISAAQAILRDMRDVLPVDQNAAGLDVVKTQQQIDERRLAGARAADEPDFLARPNRQRQRLENTRRSIRRAARPAP